MKRNNNFILLYFYIIRSSTKYLEKNMKIYHRKAVFHFSFLSFVKKESIKTKFDF